LHGLNAVNSFDLSLPYYLAGGGLLLLYAGGEALVRGGAGLARFMGLSPLLIGLVVLSAGTSAPEFFTVWRAVDTGHSDIALGTIIGSNIANILLVLGIGALIRPLPTSPKVVFRDGGVMVLACLVFAAMAHTGTITRNFGYGLIGGLFAFLLLAFASDWRRPSEHSMFVTRAAMRPDGEIHPAMAMFLLALGCLFLFFGANFVTAGGVALARIHGVSEGAVALTLIAVGGSLPELFTTIVATARGYTGLAVGNLVGSTIFSLLGVTGTVAAIHPISVSASLAHQDAIILAGACVMLVPLLNSSWRLSRPEGLLLLIFYTAYIGFVAFRENLLPLAALGLS